VPEIERETLCAEVGGRDRWAGADRGAIVGRDKFPVGVPVGTVGEEAGH